MTILRVLIIGIVISCGCSVSVLLPDNDSLGTTEIGTGWSKNSINATIFRTNSITSDHRFQFVSFYDSTGHVVLAKRDFYGNGWQIRTTDFKGNVEDAHNVICLGLDGRGYLHMAWNHHNNRLNYARSTTPYSTELEVIEMVGENELKVTYPEFYRFNNGDLLFTYRDGSSGDGNLILNYYNAKDQIWSRINDVIIDGQYERNAYWQIAIDASDAIHLSWVWRETGDVATNHDLCYAVSKDYGETWERSNGQSYALPIDINNAEVIVPIPENSELINQTSMTTDLDGKPYIATFWRAADTDKVQIYMVYPDETGHWTKSQVTRRLTDFKLRGGGTKKMPISRPQIFVLDDEEGKEAGVIYRDEERGNKVTLARANLLEDELLWSLEDLTEHSVGNWEPSYDKFLLQQKRFLHLFLQMVAQGDGETIMDMPPQPVSVLEYSLK